MSAKLPFCPADILIPKTDLHKWATIACDQFTSQPDYWEKVAEEAEGAPSCLSITLPEIFLDGRGNRERINAINTTMRQFLSEDIFTEYKDALILVERTFSNGKLRRGLVGAFALDEYSYEPNAKALISPTEGTVLSRIPARVDIRKGACLELPHIMMLMDDRGQHIIESIDKSKQTLLYDFELMLGGGHIKGWLLTEDEKKRVLSLLSAHAVSCEKNGEMLFAVGDGNHSLAAAKASADIIGTPEAHCALAELVDIHSEGIEFEPIYRVVFGVDAKDVIEYLKENFRGACERKVEYFGKGFCGSFMVDGLEADVLQRAIDKYIAAHKGASVDYIHGAEAVKELCSKENTIGFIFDGMAKDELFDYVNKNGVLPRMTFSIGQATDKRYYLEARIIGKI